MEYDMKTLTETITKLEAEINKSRGPRKEPEKDLWVPPMLPEQLCDLLETIPPNWALGTPEQLKEIGLDDGDTPELRAKFDRYVKKWAKPGFIEMREKAEEFWNPKDGKVEIPEPFTPEELKDLEEHFKEGCCENCRVSEMKDKEPAEMYFNYYPKELAPERPDTPPIFDLSWQQDYDSGEDPQITELKIAARKRRQRKREIALMEGKPREKDDSSDMSDYYDYNPNNYSKKYREELRKKGIRYDFIDFGERISDEVITAWKEAQGPGPTLADYFKFYPPGEDLGLDEFDPPVTELRCLRLNDDLTEEQKEVCRGIDRRLAAKKKSSSSKQTKKEASDSSDEEEEEKQNLEKQKQRFRKSKKNKGKGKDHGASGSSDKK